MYLIAAIVNAAPFIYSGPVLLAFVVAATAWCTRDLPLRATGILRCTQQYVDHTQHPSVKRVLCLSSHAQPR